MLYQLSYSRLGWGKRENPRTDRLFRDPAVRVSLARLCFTTQFGMEWGGSTALWARGYLVLSWEEQREAKDVSESGADHPAGQDGDNGGWKVKTSSDEHQSAEGIAALTLLAS